MLAEQTSTCFKDCATANILRKTVQKYSVVNLLLRQTTK